MGDKRISLVAARRAMNLTQKQLADLVSVTETTIRNIENARANPSFTLSIALSKVLDAGFEAVWREDF